MENLDWLKELAFTERKVEEDGFLNNPDHFDLDRLLTQSSVDFMVEVKNHFMVMVEAFNELKSSTYGKIKVFHVTNTHLDFMLFRNNLKCIFSLQEPGRISVRFEVAIGPYVAFQNPASLNFSGNQKVPGLDYLGGGYHQQLAQSHTLQGQQPMFGQPVGAPLSAQQAAAQQSQAIGEHTLLSKWGPYNQIKWCFRDEEFDMVVMAKYYLSMFIRESSK